MSSTTTDFACLVSEFLTEYLPLQRNYSKNTVLSYRDAIKLFVVFIIDKLSDTLCFVRKMFYCKYKKADKYLKKEINPYPLFLTDIVGHARKIIVVLNHIRNRVPVYAIRYNFYDHDSNR